MGIETAIIASALISGAAGVYSGQQQSKAAKQASESQIAAQQQASEENIKMRLAADQNKLTSETANTTFGAVKDKKVSSSTDLLVENTFGTNKTSSSTLGF